MSDLNTTDPPATAPQPDPTTAPPPHTAPQPAQRIEQVDLLELQLGQAREQAAVFQVELRRLQLAGAEQELGRQRAASAAHMQAVQVKYSLQPGDQIAPDGTIWRAGGHG